MRYLLKYGWKLVRTMRFLLRSPLWASSIWLLPLLLPGTMGCLVSFADDQTGPVDGGRKPGCGNGAFDPGEACDDGNDADDDGCSSSCMVEEGWACTGEPSVCVPICGDGLAVGDEACDGPDLRGQTCTALGLGGGHLRCREDCSGLDTSQCGESICGDGIVSGDEACDGTNLAGMTCETLGFSGGQLLCAPDCHRFDSSDCTLCGNGIVEGDEECDGSDLQGATCEGLGYDGGILACGPDCRWDESLCYVECGDGRCDPEIGETTATCPQDCGWVRVAGGRTHACAIRADGSLWCWGANPDGRAGCNASVPSSQPQRIGLDATDVSAGEDHTCAVQPTGGVFCWGDNAFGQLGDPTWPDGCLPRHVQLPGEALTVFAARLFACSALVDGTVWCWGSGGDGNLGNGQPLAEATPVQALVQDGAVLPTGGADADFACVVTRVGTASCWGDNGDGQLGDGTTHQSDVPVPVRGLPSRVRRLTEGREHACALLADGSVACWGGNRYGQVGNGTLVSTVLEPFVVPLPSAAVSVDAGDRHTCAALDDGRVYCWGDNRSGQLGPNADLRNPEPILQPIDSVVRVGAGGRFSCAIRRNGTLWCWGDNTDGELGRFTPGDADPNPGPIMEP